MPRHHLARISYAYVDPWSCAVAVMRLLAMVAMCRARISYACVDPWSCCFQKDHNGWSLKAPMGFTEVRILTLHAFEPNS